MIKPMILSDEEITKVLPEFPIYLPSRQSDIRQVLIKGNDYCSKEMLGQFTEFLRKHCRGYHQGNNGKEFGHFGIYRDEIKALQGLEEG